MCGVEGSKLLQKLEVRFSKEFNGSQQQQRRRLKLQAFQFLRSYILHETLQCCKALFLYSSSTDVLVAHVLHVSKKPKDIIGKYKPPES